MKIYLSEDCYKWLVQLKILKAYIVHQQSINHIFVEQQTRQKIRRYELCYDDQIYLENGYLIGVLMKEILKAHQLHSDKILKIRKITVLKKNENWDIIKDVLQFLDYPFQNINQNTDSYEFSLKQIQRILQFLYNDYGPFADTRKHKDHKYFHIQPSVLHPHYQKNRLNLNLDGVTPYSYHSCNNLLEYTCFVIHKSLDYQLKIDQCMGLLVDRGKYLKRLIIQGMAMTMNNHSQTVDSSTHNRFQKVQLIYQQILNSTSRLQQLLPHQPSHTQNFMQIFSSGVLSHSQHIAKLAGLLIETVQDQQWFKTHGVKVMVRSEWPEILSLLIDMSRNFVGEVFNMEFEGMFVYEEDFLMFLIRFLPVLAKSMYSREVLQCLPLSYLIQKVTDTFDPDNISSSEPKIRQLSRQVLTILFKYFFKKIPQIQRSKACMAFEVNPYYGLTMSLHETFSLLGNLFELIKVFLINEDSTVEKYFRIVVRYLKVKEFDLREIVIENLKELYFTLRKSFPLGAFLTAYQDIVTLQPISNKKNEKNHLNTSTPLIAQNFDFQFLLVISKDQSLVEQEVVKTLNVTLEYFMQINGDCFLEIILNLLKFKESSEWCTSISEQILNKWTEIKLPQLISNSYKRKSPQEMCRFEAFGIKRRQILKFQEYQKYKLLLEAICQLKDGSFLRIYNQKVNKKVQQINRNKDLAAYNIFLKKLMQKIRLNRTLLPEPIELASKILIYLGEGMGMNDISHGLEELSEEEDKSQLMEENDTRLKKLRDEVTESPIQHNRREGESTHGRHNVNTRQGENNEVGIDDELNEFLLTKNKALKSKVLESNEKEGDDSKKTQQSRIQLAHEYLKVYTEQQYTSAVVKSQKLQSSNSFIYPQQLQQFELTYIKIQRQNNLALIDSCTKVYQQCFSHTQTQAGLIKFLSLTKLSKYLPQKQAASLWRITLQVNGVIINDDGYKEINEQRLKSIVWQLLVQYSFLMFGFKRNTRSRIKLVQIFLKLVVASLQDQVKMGGESYEKSQTIMRREMILQNRLIAGKILKWNPQYQNRYMKGELVQGRNSISGLVVNNGLKVVNNQLKEEIVSKILESHQNQSSGNQMIVDGNDRTKENNSKSIIIGNQKPTYEMKQYHHNSLQPWLICFQLLNDILALPVKLKSLGIGLIQPISKITTTVIVENKHQNSDKIQKNSQLSKDKDKEQLKYNQINEENQMSDEEIQLKLLEEGLQKLENSASKSMSPNLQRQRKANNNNNNNNKLNNNQKLFQQVKSTNQNQQKIHLTKKQKKKPPKLEYSTIKQQQKLPNVSFSKISASQLQQKIRYRKQQVKQEIKKKPQQTILNQENDTKTHEQIDLNKNNKKTEINEKISYNIDA